MFAHKVFGDPGMVVISLIVAVMLLGTAHGNILAVSRYLFSLCFVSSVSGIAVFVSTYVVNMNWLGKWHIISGTAMRQKRQHHPKNTIFTLLKYSVCLFICCCCFSEIAYTCAGQFLPPSYLSVIFAVHKNSDGTFQIKTFPCWMCTRAHIHNSMFI